jgi:hypothetical protein
VLGREHPKAECRAQAVELLAPGLGPLGVVRQGFGVDADLLGDEAQRRCRNGLARAEQPPGEAEGAELQREAEPVVMTTPALDNSKVGHTEGPVPDQVSLPRR